MRQSLAYTFYIRKYRLEKCLWIHRYLRVIITSCWFSCAVLADQINGLAHIPPWHGQELFFRDCGTLLGKMLLLLLGFFVCSAMAEVIKTKVAILGGGMSGTMAARTLARANISDFLIVEARHELGGRIMDTEFAGKTVELGANWIQGTENNEAGQINPIWDLALQYVPLMND